MLPDTRSYEIIFWSVIMALIPLTFAVVRLFKRLWRGDPPDGDPPMFV